MTPDDLPLPRFLDPLLDYLADALPPPLYWFLLNFVSHGMAVVAALFSLLSSLASTNPLNWDAQTVLPPLISLLMAYLALVSLYRTTSWMIRTSLWFIKWGTIFGALMAGVGWYMGNAGNGVGNRGIVTTLGGYVLNMIAGQNQDSQGEPRAARPKGQSSRSQRKTTKPKAQESFDRHREYRREGGQMSDAQKIMEDIASATEKVLKESGWLNVAKSVWESSFGQGSREDGEEGRFQRSRSR
ncbi:hypothetical protein BD779DRAFT_1512738 [Infundibulicybe gibba]|nr:hypothetical protein BD779DRAFT_1512738 [Infundibulicybe gibba]